MRRAYAATTNGHRLARLDCRVTHRVGNDFGLFPFGAQLHELAFECFACSLLLPFSLDCRGAFVLSIDACLDC